MAQILGRFTQILAQNVLQLIVCSSALICGKSAGTFLASAGTSFAPAGNVLTMYPDELVIYFIPGFTMIHIQ